MENDMPQCWRELCAQATVEHDPTKLLALVTEINRVLEEQERLNALRRNGALSLVMRPNELIVGTDIR